MANQRDRPRVPWVSCVRNQKLDFRGLQGQERHERRIAKDADGKKLRLRHINPDAKFTALVAVKEDDKWRYQHVRPDEAETHEDMSLVKFWRAHKKRHGAVEDPRSTFVCENICTLIPKEYFELPSAERMTTEELIQMSIDWCESEYGEGSVIHARADMDESHPYGGWIDMYVAPIHTFNVGGSKTKQKTIISTNQANKTIASRYGVSTKETYTPIQDSWSNYAARMTGQPIVRGEDKAITGREHENPNAYAARQEKQAKREAESARRNERIADSAREYVVEQLQELRAKKDVLEDELEESKAKALSLTERVCNHESKMKHLTSLLKRFEVNMQKMWEVITAVSTKHIDGVGGELLSKLNDAGVQLPDVLINEHKRRAKSVQQQSSRQASPRPSGTPVARSDKRAASPQQLASQEPPRHELPKSYATMRR